jgi:TatD DNase family protein
MLPPLYSRKTMHLVDSHCHLDDYEDLPAILANARTAGVSKLLAIGIGDGPDTMHRALDLARTHPEIFATAGIHPQEAHHATPEALAKLTTLAAAPRCLAIGEIGLDYYHLDNPDIPTQQAAFIAQMKIAAAARKPITIHCRTSELAIPAAKAKYEPANAWEDLLTLIAEYWTPTGLPGIMHCFSGNEDQAARSLAAGFYLSFAGNVTYPKSTTIQAVAATAPADRILVETDAPFLAPIPLRGQTNEPSYVTHTARFVADLRGISADHLAKLTTSNFDALFPTSLSVLSHI